MNIEKEGSQRSHKRKNQHEHPVTKMTIFSQNKICQIPGFLMWYCYLSFSNSSKSMDICNKKNAPKSFSRKNTQMDDLILALSTRALQVYSLTARLMRSGSDINKSSPATYKHFIPWVPHEIKNKNFKITKITWHSSSVVNFFECSQSSLSKGCSMETSGYSSGHMEEEISDFIFLTIYET